MGLAEVCSIAGVRHRNEMCLGIPVTLQATLVRVVRVLCRLTGVEYSEMPDE